MLIRTCKGREFPIFDHRHDRWSFSFVPHVPIAIDLIWLSELKVDFGNWIIGS